MTDAAATDSSSIEENLLHSVEKFLRSSQTAPSRLGRDVMGDPTFVQELRRGRAVRRKTAQKVMAYMASPPVAVGAD